MELKKHCEHAISLIVCLTEGIKYFIGFLFIVVYMERRGILGGNRLRKLFFIFELRM